MKADQPWDWPPEQHRPPPRPRRTTLYFDGTIQRQPSWWSTIGRIVFRAGVTVFVTAVCVVLSVVVGAAMWLLIALLKAAAQ
jgi:hypothetical protein